MRTFVAVLTIAAGAASGCANVSVPANAERKAAPALELELVDGSGTFSLQAQKGKVVLVDLWATWCAPCIAELPHLQKLSESYDPGDFTMVGVVLDSGDKQDILEFIKKKSVTYPNLLGEEGAKESFGPFSGYPTKYLIDREGYIVKKYFGAGGTQLAEDVERLVRTGVLETTE